MSKVLLVNKFFYLKGGDCQVFFDTAKLLQTKGHKSVFFAMQHPLNLASDFAPYFVSELDIDKDGLLNKLKVASRVIYSREAKRKIEQLIKKEKPDIAHLHNIYHHISPSILSSLKKASVPTVMTLHDYKLVCPSYTLLVNGKICEACENGSYYHVALNRCLKGSLAKSILSMIEMYTHHRFLHIYDLVDIYISPSAFLKQKLKQTGFKGEVEHLPNFIDVAKFTPAHQNDGQTIVYFGRLSAEKGLLTLLQAAKMLKGKFVLKIIGDGPQKEELVNFATTQRLADVHFLGFKNEGELKKELSNAIFTVIPSILYENYPRSVIESFALGKPVIGARIGGIPELVKDEQTGFTFKPGSPEDLASKIDFLLSHPNRAIEMGRNARQFVEKELNPDKHYQGLMAIYQRAKEKAKNTN